VQFGSGVLVSPQVFLTVGDGTARFEAAGLTRAQVTFDPIVTASPTWYQGTIHTSPFYDPAGLGNRGDFSDLGVIVFDHPVTGITPATLPTSGYLDQITPLSGLRLSGGRIAGRCSTKLPEGPALELPDPFGTDTELLGDLPTVLGLAVETEASSKYVAFAFAEAAEEIAQLAGGDVGDHPFVFILSEGIGDELAEGSDRSFLAMERLFNRPWRTVHRDQVGQLVGTEPRFFRELVDRWFLIGGLLDVSVGLFDARELAQCVVGEDDRARQLGGELLHG
jgi:hypothetical protein